MHAGLRLIHLDDTLLVVDKPSGLLSVPGRAADPADCVVAQVRERWAPDAREVHRLDMATSGLMVLARGVAAHRSLCAAFAERRVFKRYEAVLAGHVPVSQGAATGCIDLPLLADWPHRPRQKVDLLRGKPSVTHWQCVSLGSVAGLPCARLHFEPVTGRSHQLRVHALAIGHPILGDSLYAPPEAAQASERLLLHASALHFQHPASGEALAFESLAEF